MHYSVKKYWIRYILPWYKSPGRHVCWYFKNCSKNVNHPYLSFAFITYYNFFNAGHLPIVLEQTRLSCFGRTILEKENEIRDLLAVKMHILFKIIHVKNYYATRGRINMFYYSTLLLVVNGKHQRGTEIRYYSWKAHCILPMLPWTCYGVLRSAWDLCE